MTRDLRPDNTDVPGRLGALPLGSETYPGAGLIAPDKLLRPLSEDDLDLAWGLDFHYPRGVLPLSHELLATLLASSRTAAQGLPAVTGRGLVSRVIGPHVYTAGLPVEDPAERAERAAAAAAEVARYPGTFPALWSAQCQELEDDYAALRSVDLEQASEAVLTATFDHAVAHFGRAWEIHFEVMYRLLAVVEVFRTACRGLGIDDASSADLLSSGDTAIQRADVALRALAEQAKAAGLRPLFDRRQGLLRALERDPLAQDWLGSFWQYVATFGERTDCIVDVGSAAWTDDPEQPLGLIRDLLVNGAESSTCAQLMALERARDERCAAIATSLPARDRAVFARGIGQCRMANFAWWNEDHNALIDLRAHLPVRRVAREIARRRGLSADDAAFLFADEIRTLHEGEGMGALAAERRDYYQHWQSRRAALPRGFGTPPEVNDPVLAEIIGLPPTRGEGAEGHVLQGLGISPGIARGTARVVTTPDELHRLQAGDILVCEATSPSWTMAFPRLAACVCDSGGALTHAAIICREYGLPCVSAVGVATRVLRDGDMIEVDGRAGTVTVIGASS